MQSERHSLGQANISVLAYYTQRPWVLAPEGERRRKLDVLTLRHRQGQAGTGRVIAACSGPAWCTQ